MTRDIRHTSLNFGRLGQGSIYNNTASLPFYFGSPSFQAATTVFSLLPESDSDGGLNNPSSLITIESRVLRFAQNESFKPEVTPNVQSAPISRSAMIIGITSDLLSVGLISFS